MGGGGGGGGGRGQTRCIIGDVLLANIPFSGHFLTIVKRGHIAALLTLKCKWFDTLTGEIKINNDVLLFSATNEETPCEELLRTLLVKSNLRSGLYGVDPFARGYSA